MLAEKLKELLLMIDPDDAIKSGTPARDPAYALSAPIEPEWRVGTIGLTYDDPTGSVVVALEPAPDPDAEDNDDAGPDVDDFAVRVLLHPDQARAFVLHALAIVGEGRPLCQLCGLPMDPDGHRCPASNGHRLS